MAKHDIDHVSGTPTTGHEWDGIKELNTPLPRWWLYVFYATIVWGLGYVIAFPAWPLVNSYTTGVPRPFAARVSVGGPRAVLAARATFGRGARRGDVQQINADRRCWSSRCANGRAAFGDNCAPCHGTGATGSTRISEPPGRRLALGRHAGRHRPDDPLRHPLRPSGHPHQRHAGLRQGPDPRSQADPRRRRLCRDPLRRHTLRRRRTSRPAGSSSPIIAPPATARTARASRKWARPTSPTASGSIGGDEATIVQTITNARRGVMPAWESKLDPVTIKSLAVFVHSLGGGDLTGPLAEGSAQGQRRRDRTRLRRLRGVQPPRPATPFSARINTCDNALRIWPLGRSGSDIGGGCE